MDTLILPGNSPRHKLWANDLRSSLSTIPEVGTVIAQYYAHWDNGENIANIEHELLVAEQSTKELSEFAIIAKSIGALIALEGITQGRLGPERAILLGLPINDCAPRETYRTLLRNLAIPTIIIQNTNDPRGAFSELKAIIGSSQSHISLINTPGNTHDYLDFKKIGKLIS